MPGRSPPSVTRSRLVAVAVLYAAFLTYSVLVAQQVLLGISVGVLLASLYLLWRFLHVLWRFLRALEAIADALQRIARQRESE
jgi:MFS superfamily sulfate permease-like transporter